MTIADSLAEDSVVAAVSIGASPGEKSCASPKTTATTTTSSPPPSQHNNNNNNTCVTMCGTGGLQECCKKTLCHAGAVKRKLDLDSNIDFQDIRSSHSKRLNLDHDLLDLSERRPKRMSLMWNTPKQRKEDKRKVLRLSIHKLRRIDDPELFLRRSVLINNTMQRLQRELREEKHYTQPVRFCRDDYPTWEQLEGASCDAADLPSPSTYTRHQMVTDDVTNNNNSSPMDVSDCVTSDSSDEDDSNEAFLKSLRDLDDGPPLTPLITPIDDGDTTTASSSLSSSSSMYSSSHDALLPPCLGDDDLLTPMTEVLPASQAIFPDHSSSSAASTTYSYDTTYSITSIKNNTISLTNDSPLTDREKQILSEFDAVFNNLINTLTES